MNYCETTALDTIRSMQARIRVVQGGTSAGKTIATLLDELNEAIEQPGILTSIVTDSMPNLRRGAMRDFLKICQATNVLAVADWNKASSTLTLPNGSVIEFFSVDMLGALGARRDRLFINEANRISWDTFSQLEPRTRQKITLDFNPVNEFWAHTELVNNPAFADAVEFVKLTYLDNEALEDEKRTLSLLVETNFYGEQPQAPTSQEKDEQAILQMLQSRPELFAKLMQQMIPSAVHAQ